MRRCEFERANFPDSEFRHDSEYGIVHEREPLHTINGDLIKKGKVPNPPARVEQRNEQDE